MSRSPNIIRKISRTLIMFFLSIIRILLVAYLLLHSNTVQNYIINKITKTISEELSTKVEIDHIDFELFNKIVLEKVYVEDLQNDTLLFIDELKLALNKIDLSNNNINLNKIIFQNTYINAYADTAKIFNYQFIVDALDSQEKDTTKSNWNIYCNNFKLIDSRLIYRTSVNTDDTLHEILDFNNLALNRVNIEINDVNIIEDTILFNIENFNCTDKSGFKLDNFHASCSIDSTKIFLSEVNLHTANSKLNFSELSLKYKNFNDDFNDFINKVKIDARLISSQFGLADLSYFAPKLKGLNQNFFFSGIIKGKISRIKFKGFELFYGENTHLEGDLSFDGLPDIENTFVHANIKELTTNTSDLEKIQVPPFNKNSTLQLPDEIKHFGNILYKGNFTGFTSDFVAYGNFTTAAGNIVSDISIKQDTINKHIAFTGKIKTENLNIGKIASNEKTLGLLSLNAKIDGYSNLNGKNVKGRFDGIINNIDLLDYNYQNLKIEGDIDNKMFNGLLFVDDPNMKMDFLGTFDFNEDIPVFDFTADIFNLNFNKLNIDTLDTAATISLILTANFEGDKLDEMQGNIDIEEIYYTNKNGDIALDAMQITSEKDGDKRNVVFNSDIVDANISGVFRFSTLQHSYHKFIERYLPALSTKNGDIAENEQSDEFEFNLKLKNTRHITELFMPDIKLSKNSKLKGYFNSANDSLNIYFQSNKLELYGLEYEMFVLKTKTNNSNLNLSLRSNKLYLKENTFIKNLRINNTINNNLNQISVFWNNRDTVEYSGEIFADAMLSKSDSAEFPIIDIQIIPSMLVLANDMWFINDCSFKIDSSFIKINKFTLNNNQQYIYANGLISENPNDSLQLIFNDIMLANINLFIAESGIELKGILNGDAKLSDFYNNPMAIAQIDINKLSINKQLLGNMFVSSKWNNNANKVNMNAYVMRGKLKTIDINGGYYTKADILDFKLSLNKFKLNILDPFVEGILTQVKGIAGGEVFVSGKSDNPILNGKISLQKTSFTIDYLQTRYNLTDYIFISEDKISFELVKMYDRYGNQAMLNGNITHNNFKDIKFNADMNIDKFLVLDTKEKDNELFYGKAFMSGLINIDGNKDNINMKIAAKTEKYYHKFEKRTEYTKFYIPLFTGEDISENDFITFVNTKKDTTAEKKYEVDLSGIKLNFDLEVTPDAEVQIIFDSKVGDVVKAKGNANLNMEINTLGNFSMSGEYVIEEGDYLFTLQNVINKKFDVEKGGYVKWNGSPYNAYMDINAIYRLKTSLYDLTLDTSYMGRVPVECHLRMTDNLLTPDINFNIIIPSGGDEATGILSKMSDEEINKQILSLLVLNRFYTPPSLRDVNPSADYKNANPVGVTSSELLSNQLSHWLSQISNDFDIGVNYHPGDELTKDEMEVALSTQLLNDRVSINGNVGVGGEYASSSNIVGDFNVDVKINKSGKLKIKGYSKANHNLVYEESPHTQGVGLFYKEEFNSWGQLMRRYFRGKAKE